MTTSSITFIRASSVAIGAVLLISGCGPYDGESYGGQSGQAGDAELFIDVSFGGVVPCSSAGVDEVAISFPNGEISSETVSCDAKGVQFDVVPITVGMHRITVQGLQQGTVVFSLTQDVKVRNGSQEIAMDLAAGSGQTATLLVTLSFAGQKTCTGAGVDQVRLSFPGGDAPAQSVSCSTFAVQLSVPSLTLGVHHVKAEGLKLGQTLFSLTQDVTVAADGAAVPLDLVAVAPAQTAIVAAFVFGAPQSSDPNPAGMTCAEAGAQSVSVTVDRGTPVIAPCHDNVSGHDSLAVPTVAGSHTFVWAAFAGPNATGTQLYGATLSSAAVQAGTSQPMSVNMVGLENGGFSVQWQFPGMKSCADEGVATVTYDVADALGNELPGMPITQACAPMGFMYASSPGLAAGVYALVSMKAENANQSVLFRASNIRVYAPAGGQATFTVALSP